MNNYIILLIYIHKYYRNWYKFLIIIHKKRDNMIKELQISTKTIFLEGLSLKGEFQIYNPNKILAISFEI